jgi:nucleoside-specific outer membrane channel protein Tsx
MRKSRLASLVALGAIALPLVACTASVVAASPRTTSPIGKQLAELKGSDTVAGDGLGSSVAISGSTAIVGAYDHAKDAGRAYVFTMTGSGWHQVAELQGSDTVAGDEFGSSVAVSGTTAIVGAGDHAEHAGRAYVFTKTPGGWKQVAELKGSDTMAGDYFGWSVAISGATVVVGAYGHAKNAGRAYVFTETPKGWKQAAELKCANILPGDQFGSSVAVSGPTMVVGATNRADAAGRAYVFSKTGTSWKQAAKLEGSDTISGDHFGWSVAISGTTAVVGAFLHAKSAGRAYVFTKASGWKQTAELKGLDTAPVDGFGISVAIAGTTLAVGATGHAAGAGRAYVFTKTPGGWKQVAELKGLDTAPGDEFGFSLGISGTTAVVGAPVHASHAGRAYVLKA